jgi:hypothetical protein
VSSAIDTGSQIDERFENTTRWVLEPDTLLHPCSMHRESEKSEVARNRSAAPTSKGPNDHAEVKLP